MPSPTRGASAASANPASNGNVPSETICTRSPAVRRYASSSALGERVADRFVSRASTAIDATVAAYGHGLDPHRHPALPFGVALPDDPRLRVGRSTAVQRRSVWATRSSA